MEQLLSNALAGWAAVVFGTSLISALWILPFVVRRARHDRVRRALAGDVELRMMAGFVVDGLGVALFAGFALVSSLLLSAGLIAPSVLLEVATWTVMVPSGLMIIAGNALMLWDGLNARRGRRGCLWLIGAAVLLWLAGAASANLFRSMYSG